MRCVDIKNLNCLYLQLDFLISTIWMVDISNWIADINKYLHISTIQIVDIYNYKKVMYKSIVEIYNYWLIVISTCHISDLNDLWSRQELHTNRTHLQSNNSTRLGLGRSLHHIVEVGMSLLSRTWPSYGLSSTDVLPFNSHVMQRCVQ